MRNLFSLFWRGISSAGTLAWVLSFGVGGLVSSVLASFVEMDQPWRSFFFVSILLIGTALSLPVAKSSVLWLGAVLPLPKSASPESLTFGQASEAYKDVKREELAKKHDRQIHKALTLLRGELSANEALLAEAKKNKRYWELNQRSLDSYQWREHYVELAAEPTLTDLYVEIDDAYREIGRIEDLVESRAREAQGSHAASAFAPMAFSYILEGDRLEEAITQVWRAKHQIDVFQGRERASRT